MSMQDERHRVAANWLFEAARAEERRDLEGFTVDRLLDGRVMKQRNHLAGPNTSEGRLELQRLVHGFVHEPLDDRLAPGTQRALPESSTESLDPGDADPMHF